MTRAELFWKSVQVRGVDECWPWTRHKTRDGHGMVSVRCHWTTAHRFAWELYTGVRPEHSDFIMHTCDNPPCCNPAHLVLGNHQANMADMVAKGRGRNANSGKTHCIHGHPLSGDNVRFVKGKKPGKVSRQCKACSNRRRRDRRTANSEREEAA